MFTDPVAEKKFAQLQKQFGFMVCVETGTHFGHGAMHASRYCDVLTIDTNRAFREQAMENWLRAGFVVRSFLPVVWFLSSESIHGIFSLEGSSPEMLRKYLPKWDSEDVCFYLDAHWEAYWPLLDELKAIAEAGFKDSVIIIHDFKVPGRESSFDSYEGQDLDFDYVKDALAAINPDYVISYNDGPPGIRGILYATPEPICS